MIVGVPREVKSDEYRVAMIPVGVEELRRAGHRVLVQTGAGQGTGVADERYAAHGAEIVPDAATMEQWRAGLEPVTDRYIADLTAHGFPNARIAYDKVAAALRR